MAVITDTLVKRWQRAGSAVTREAVTRITRVMAVVTVVTRITRAAVGRGCRPSQLVAAAGCEVTLITCARRQLTVPASRATRTGRNQIPALWTGQLTVSDARQRWMPDGRGQSCILTVSVVQNYSVSLPY